MSFIVILSDRMSMPQQSVWSSLLEQLQARTGRVRHLLPRRWLHHRNRSAFFQTRVRVVTAGPSIGVISPLSHGCFEIGCVVASRQHGIFVLGFYSRFHYNNCCRGSHFSSVGSISNIVVPSCLLSFFSLFILPQKQLQSVKLMAQH